MVNSLAPGKFEWNFRHVIFKQILVIDDWGISYEFALIWMSLDFTDDQSTLVQVMPWCHHATSHYLSQCWPRSLSPYGVTRPQWAKIVQQLNDFLTFDPITFNLGLKMINLPCFQDIDDIWSLAFNMWTQMTSISGESYLSLVAFYGWTVAISVAVLTSVIVYMWNCYDETWNTYLHFPSFLDEVNGTGSWNPKPWKTGTL